MRITEFERTEAKGEVRVSATVAFEDSDRPAQRLFVSCTGEGADALEARPDAFLAAAFPMAAWAGERRVHVEGPICSTLRQGLDDAQRLWSVWWPHVSRPVIEPTEGFRATRPLVERRTAALVSGGIDSLALLRGNRNAYPGDHPDAVKLGIFLMGYNSFDHEGDDLRPERVRAYEAAIERLRGLGENAGFELLVLQTNFRLLYDWPTYTKIGASAALAAPALLLGGRITDLLVGSTGWGAGLPPHGTHPSLDGLYSTAAVRIQHAQPYMHRFEKTKLVASWPDGLRVLQVCLHFEDPTANEPNCGRCQKCVRTLLALAALGGLESATTFPVQEVTPEMVEDMSLHDVIYARLFEPLVPRLEAVGREDLARALARKLDRLHKRDSWLRRTGRAVDRLMPWRW